MLQTLHLNNKRYPFRSTPEGVTLIRQLGVDLARVKAGHAESVQRCAYCIAAGAAKADGIDFPFATVDSFLHAADRWPIATAAEIAGMALLDKAVPAGVKITRVKNK